MSGKQLSSIALACLAAAGVVGTAILAAKATPKALRLVEEAEWQKGEKLTNLETAKAAAPAYLPALAACGATCACILGTSLLSKGQQAALAGGYALIENAYREYKKLRGPDQAPPDDILPDDSGKKLFYERTAGLYFERSVGEVLEAEYRFNQQFLRDGYACLNDYLACMGLELLDGGNAVGWSVAAGEAGYGYSCVDFDHVTVEMEDGMECSVICMLFPPTEDFMEF